MAVSLLDWNQSEIREPSQISMPPISCAPTPAKDLLFARNMESLLKSGLQAHTQMNAMNQAWANEVGREP